MVGPQRLMVGPVPQYSYTTGTVYKATQFTIVLSYFVSIFIKYFVESDLLSNTLLR